MFKFLFGAMVGAAIALLMAPKSGEDLREDLSSQVHDSIKRGKRVARTVSQRARELGEQAQEQVG